MCVLVFRSESDGSFKAADLKSRAAGADLTVWVLKASRPPCSPSLHFGPAGSGPNGENYNLANVPVVWNVYSFVASAVEKKTKKHLNPHFCREYRKTVKHLSGNA